MKDNRTFKFFAVVLIIAVLCLLAFTGLGPESARIVKVSTMSEQASIFAAE